MFDLIANKTNFQAKRKNIGGALWLHAKEKKQKKE